MMTIENMRVRCGLAETDSSKDEIIYENVDAAISIIEQYLDRGILSDSVNETFTHIDADTIQLFRYPIVPGSLMVMDPDNLKYHVDEKNGIVMFDGHITEHKITIDYEGGYVGDLMPVVLRTAVLRVFDTLGLDFNTSPSTGDVGGVSRITVPDVGTIAYATKSTDEVGSNEFIDNTTKFLLEPYKRKVV